MRSSSVNNAAPGLFELPFYIVKFTTTKTIGHFRFREALVAGLTISLESPNLLEEKAAGSVAGD